MKKFGKILLLCVLSLVFGGILVACTGDNIVVNNQGTQWTAGIYTPDSTQGKDGDFYLNTTNNTIYQKVDGTWVAMANIKGESGKDGESFDAKELFDLAVEKGVYEDSAQGFKQFILDYTDGTLDEEVRNYLLGLTIDSVATIGAKCLHQVVGVDIPIRNGLDSGSGIIYKITDNYAYVVTNYHIVSVLNRGEYTTAQEIYLYTYNARDAHHETDGTYTFGPNSIMATYIGGASAYDIAILKVEGTELAKLKAAGAQEVTFGQTNNLQPGLTAIAIGNALGEGLSLTTGVISLDSERVRVTIAGSSEVIRSLRMDTTINNGNSGGGIFNIKGELIGITDSKQSRSSNINIDNICNAIPATDAKAVIENIVYYYEQALADDSVVDKISGVHKYVFGFVYTTINSASSLGADNLNILSNQVYVEEVLEDSTAESIGLKQGDIVKAIIIIRDGNSTRYDITLDYELLQHILSLKLGDQVAFVVEREDSDSGDKTIVTTSTHEVVDEGYSILLGTEVLHRSSSDTSTLDLSIDTERVLLSTRVLQSFASLFR